MRYHEITEAKADWMHAEFHRPSFDNLLLPLGQTDIMGAKETGEFNQNGISIFRANRDMYRLVYAEHGVIVAVLHLTSRDGKHAKIQNVYTRPDHWRQGLATMLLQKAEEMFEKVRHSPDHSLTRHGAQWKYRMLGRLKKSDHRGK